MKANLKVRKKTERMKITFFHSFFFFFSANFAVFIYLPPGKQTGKRASGLVGQRSPRSIRLSFTIPLSVCLCVCEFVRWLPVDLRAALSAC